MLTVIQPHWVCPHSERVCFPSLHCSDSRLLWRNCLKWALVCMHFPGLSLSGSGSRVLHRGADLVGPSFCTCPRSKQLKEPGAWCAGSPPVEGCNLSPPPSQTLGFLGLQWAAFSGVPCVSSGELISGCDPTGRCRPSRIPRNLGEQQSLLAVWCRMPLWGRDCPLPALAALAGLSLAGYGLAHSQLALLCPLFHEHAWRCLQFSSVQLLSRVQLFATL